MTYDKRSKRRAWHTRVLDKASALVLGPTYRGWITMHGQPGVLKEHTPSERSAPAPSTDRCWGDWTKPLGLSIEFEDQEAHIQRHGHSLSLPLQEAFIMDITWRARRTLWCHLLAARLILDSQALEYSTEMERPATPDVVWRKEDIPPEHGERMPWVVPNELVTLLETHHEAVWATPIERTDLSTIYVQEFGQHWHVMTQTQRQTHPLGEEKIATDARRALFYQSYKVRPSKTEKFPYGRIKTIETVEGLGASRLHLLPDYDYDAARAHGYCALPTRHTLLIAQPHDDQTRETTLDRLVQERDHLLETALWPLSDVIYDIVPDQPVIDTTPRIHTNV